MHACIHTRRAQEHGERKADEGKAQPEAKAGIQKANWEAERVREQGEREREREPETWDEGGEIMGTGGTEVATSQVHLQNVQRDGRGVGGGDLRSASGKGKGPRSYGRGVDDRGMGSAGGMTGEGLGTGGGGGGGGGAGGSLVPAVGADFDIAGAEERVARLVEKWLLENTGTHSGKSFSVPVYW